MLLVQVTIPFTNTVIKAAITIKKIVKNAMLKKLNELNGLKNIFLPLVYVFGIKITFRAR